MSTEKSQKIPDKYCCEICLYMTINKKDYSKHLSTRKHQNNCLSTKINNNSQEIPKSYVCICGKEYKERTGLWRHKKSCDFENEPDNDLKIDNELSDKNLIIMLMKKNDELQNMMMEVIKNGTHNNITTTNSHNKAFNLNFFLNETCKDAMNIMDFVESIKLQLSDLERVGELGYVEGISNIIVKNLKDLDVTQRPVHCTDKKRETMYIKDENKWEKDEEQKKMHKMVRKVADKNARMLPKFKEAHPDCIKSASLFSDQYNKIIMEAMGGKGDNDFEKEEKIIKKVSKEVLVEKE
jgi:hypothetical protein